MPFLAFGMFHYFTSGCIVDSSCGRTSKSVLCEIIRFVLLPGLRGRVAESAVVVQRRGSDVFMSVDEVGAWEHVTK